MCWQQCVTAQPSGRDGSCGAMERLCSIVLKAKMA